MPGGCEDILVKFPLTKNQYKYQYIYHVLTLHKHKERQDKLIYS